jgi:hypothetical protein
MEVLGNWALLLYSDVKNMKEVLDMAAARGNYGGRACFIRPSLILSPLQLGVAMQRLIHQKHLRSKSFATELMLLLAPTRNVDTAIKTFSCDDLSKDCLVAIYLGERDKSSTSGHQTPEVRGIISDVEKLIAGKQLPLTKLSTMTDEQAVATLFGVTSAELSTTTLSDIVVNRLATLDL